MTLPIGPHIVEGTPREQYLANRVRELQAKLELVHERLSELERLFGTEDELMPLRMMGFTGNEARLLHVLRAKPIVTRDQMFFALYADDPDRMAEVEPKIVDVVVCKLRSKLRRMGVDIETVFACGFRLTQSQKARLARLVASGAAVASGRSSDMRLLHRRQRAGHAVREAIREHGLSPGAIRAMKAAE